MSAATEKILFTCAGCGYKARIPSHYAGRSIHCPQCKSVQAVPAVEEPSGGAPVISAEPAPAAAPVGGKIVFACTSCSYKGRLSAEYEGKTIRCPGCQTPQVVKGTPLPSPIVASLAADEPVFKGMEGDKVRFVCASCGYRARIPSKYAGKPIHCPQCKKVEVVKPEADMEESTGKTVSISKISSVEVKEPRLAMTNVGVQFACAVCGYESRISPSCVGDAIYCPKCRSPQKVEWSDPAAAKPEAETVESALEAKSAAPAPVAPEAKPEPLPSLIDDEPALPAPKPSIAPARMATPLPVAPPVPVAPVAQPGMVGDITDIQSILDAPEEPKPPVIPVKPIKQGGRRVITAAPRAPVEPAAAEEPVEPAPAPRASAPAAPAKRRSVAVPAGAKSAKAASGEDEPDTEETAQALPPRRPAPVATAAPASASKLPMIIIAAVAALLLVFVGVLFMQTKSLSAKVGDLETAQTKAQDEAREAKKAAEAAAQAKAEVEKQLAEAQAAAESAKLAAEAAKLELEKLKAAPPPADAAVPAPDAAKPAGAEKPADPAPLPEVKPAP